MPQLLSAFSVIAPGIVLPPASMQSCPTIKPFPRYAAALFPRRLGTGSNHP